MMTTDTVIAEVAAERRHDYVAALKAYECHDGGEQSAIIFAANGAAARRFAAEEFQVQFQDVESCRRAPQFDQYTPGPVPGLVLIENGWWIECAHCGIRIDLDHYDIEGDRILDPVEEGCVVYCSPSCLHLSRAEREERKTIGDEAVRGLGMLLLARFPGVSLTGHNHVYVGYRRRISSGARRVEQCVVGFTFPGALVGEGLIRFDEPYGEPVIMICKGDRDAWNQFVSGKMEDQS